MRSQAGDLNERNMLGSRARPAVVESRINTKSVARRRRIRSKKEEKSAMVFVLRAAMALVAVWACYLLVFSAPSGGSYENVPESRPSKIRGTGPELLERLFRLGENDPAALGRVLEEEDPLKVSVDNPGDFECPRQEGERFSLPDERNRTLEQEFKEGRGFIYYQHLRKAGGTGFCEMASRNMRSSEVPTYHCMPDNRGAMATPPWSNREYLLGNMQQNGFRITANEWDVFLEEHLTLPGAVFATTFRHPVDRWYSQYRFEHVEHRDGSRKDSTPLSFDSWYKRVKPFVMGDNYYVKTFYGLPNPPENVLKSDLDRQGRPKYIHDLNWSYHKFNTWGDKVTWEQFSTAIDILKRFNLILVLDFVDDEMWALEESFGWTQPRKVVLPHEKQAVRESKKSISAREALEDDVWAETLQSNVFDVLLFHWAKRVYLERSSCRHSDVGGVETERKRR